MNVEPVRLEISSDPPSIKVDGVEIVQAVIRVELVIDGDGSRALLDLRADVAGFEFPTTIVRSASLEGLTARELDQVILDRGYSESAGAAVLGHLNQRAGGGG